MLFLASDNADADAEPMRGSAMILMLDDRDRTVQVFDVLGRDWQVTTPPGVQPWGGFHGKLTDRFGVQWMLNCRLTGVAVATL